MSAPTWYEDTAIEAPAFAATPGGETRCDVAIVGGGLAGLTLLNRLIDAGTDAVLIEKDRIGAGASGRNGGFCSGGWAAGDDHIRRLVGTDGAEALDALANEGLHWMRAKCATPDFAAAGAKPGVLTVGLSGAAPAGALGATDTRRLTDSPRYRYGMPDTEAFQFHPLNFMRCLAGETCASGGRIFEDSALQRIDLINGRMRLMLSNGGTVLANRVVLATGGYGGPETGPLARLLLRIRTYIGVTEPLGETGPIQTEMAVGDTRRAGNYYRKLPDQRLLWGHGITAFGTLDRDRILTATQTDMAAIFPGFRPRLDYGWGGNMAYAPHLMPLVGPLAPGLYALTGFGGHGMNTAPIAAIVLAEHLCGKSDRLRHFAPIPKAWNMGPAGPYAVEAQYRLLRLRDWLAERWTA